MSQILKAGLIGYGVAGQNFHAPFIDTHPYMELAKVVERNSEKSKERYPNVTVVKNVDDLLSDPSVDLVVIATPNSTHYDLAKAALNAGKHVVIDKPFTSTSEEAAELIRLSKEKNKIVSVYHNRRWDGGFLTVKKILKEGLLGKVVEYEAHFDRFRNKVNPNAWKEKELAGSGLLYDLGSHLIDQSLVLFGWPKSVLADIRSQREGAIMDDYFEINLMYDNLKVTLKAGVLVREPSPIFIIHGTEGSYVKYGLDPQEAALRLGTLPTEEGFGVEDNVFWGKLNTEVDGKLINGQFETLPGAYKDFYANIYNAIIGTHALAVKPEEAMNVIKIIEAAKLSKDERGWVNV